MGDNGFAFVKGDMLVMVFFVANEYVEEFRLLEKKICAKLDFGQPKTVD